MGAAAILIDKINMQDLDWIEGKAAMALLGVKPQTLYAYVSRGLLRVKRDAFQQNRSLYHYQDLCDLRAAHQRPRARAKVAAQAIDWGEPLLETSISRVEDGELYFGRLLARDCAENMSVEEIAAHHWHCEHIPKPVALHVPMIEGDPLERALVFLAHQVAQVQSESDDLTEASSLLSGLVTVFTGHESEGPMHLRLAEAWGLKAREAQALRRAMVLSSDHDLNPSTFALRVCASTGAGLAACILAALATLSGPKHGGAAKLARQALRAEMGGEVAFESFLKAHEDLSLYGFGFSHPLYPKGDPRAAALFEAGLGARPAGQAALRIAARLGLAPNIDGALAVLSEELELPEEAAFILFCLGRFTGWVAHAREQRDLGQIIRPRARYVQKSP